MTFSLIVLSDNKMINESVLKEKFTHDTEVFRLAAFSFRFNLKVGKRSRRTGEIITLRKIKKTLHRAHLSTWSQVTLLI